MKTGRPKVEINWGIFEELCHIQCTPEEIASVLKVGRSTLYDRVPGQYENEEFSTIYKRFSESGKTSLRRAQFKMAQKSATMAIWLGKQYLGQKDTFEAKEFDANTLNQFKAWMETLSKSQLSASNTASININREIKS